jgi:hypothetical protein
MRNATHIALLALLGLASLPAEAGAPPRIVTPRISPQVIDSHNLASRNINILRLRILKERFQNLTPGPTVPMTPGRIPGTSPK